jgi:hypothetical protein
MQAMTSNGNTALLLTTSRLVSIPDGATATPAAKATVGDLGDQGAEPAGQFWRLG